MISRAAEKVNALFVEKSGREKKTILSLSLRVKRRKRDHHLKQSKTNNKKRKTTQAPGIKRSQKRKSERVRVPTDSTAESELFAGWRVKEIQRAPRRRGPWPTAVVTVVDGKQRVRAGPGRALRQFALGHGDDSLEVVVTEAAEVGGAEAEVDGHRAAVAALRERGRGWRL